MIEPAWVVAAVSLGGVLVTVGVGWGTINHVSRQHEMLAQKVAENSEDIAALKAYNGLPPRR